MSELHPNAILEGGPEWHTIDPRIRHIRQEDSVVKVRAGNRYEHFHRTDRKVVHQGRPLYVFEWNRSTFVAE
jgi:hypothetical protein